MSIHLFKDILLADLTFLIASYLTLSALNSFARSDQYLLKLFFNLTVEKVELIAKRKKELKNQDIESKIVSIKDKYQEDEASLVQSVIWKPIVTNYFPNYSKTLNIKNWRHVMRRRIINLQLHYPELLILKKSNSKISTTFRSDYGRQFIENCEFEYECPLKDNSLKIVQPNVRFCTVCQENVYEVFTDEEMKSHIEQGHCVQLSKYLSEQA